ncbi:MAG: LysM2 [Candidatus Magnetoglobus multicellularis str. Araruama]|uniref:LysM2 n=1 Tax=Candidatus Magnetoglobus multicellularis str. Araruama TaxID=890399 RepID=A0A1V1P7J4_9BACT|nr:MAG: LysM2 [Candidatus Magnetoglobus multicellularis str. Araruama]
MFGMIHAAWCDSNTPKDAYYYPAIESVGFISRDSVPFAGTIHSNEHNQVMSGWDHILYIKPYRNYFFKKNALFVAYGPVEDVYSDNVFMGVHYQIKGVVEIIAMKPRFVKARIAKSYLPIRKGDHIKPYEKINHYIPITDDVPYIRSHVIASEGTRRMIGQGDIVFINKGQKNGVRPGNIFDIFEHQEKDFEMSRRTVFVDPSNRYPSGQLLILTTQRLTAAGLITWSKNELLMAHQLDVH